MLAPSPRRTVLFSFPRSLGKKGVVWGVLFPLLQISHAFGQQKPDPPTGLTVSNKTDTSATLGWNTSPGIGSYILEVGTESNKGDVFSGDVGKVGSFQLTNLMRRTTYNWNVKAKSNANVESDAANGDPFTTLDSPPPPPPPRPLPPTGLTSTPTATSVQLEWNAVTGAEKYDVEVTGPQNFKHSEKDLSAPSLSVSGLKASTTYNWQVRAKNAGGESDWTPSSFITTAAQLPPAKPSGLVVIPAATSANFIWQGVTGATSYVVEVAESPSFQNAISSSVNAPATATVVTPLVADKEYRWRIRAVGPGGESDWAAGETFRTLSTRPAAPKLVGPSNGATGVSTSPALDWSAVQGALSYEVEVAAGDNFNKTDFSGTSTNPTITASGLANNKEYSWRVRVTTTGGTSDWSTVWKFTTVATQLSAPKLISPSHNAKNIPVDPTFAWEPVAGATSYTLHVAADAKFDSLVVDSAGLEGTSSTVVGLSHNATYYWRVKALNAQGESAWSQDRSFETVALVLPVPQLQLPPDNARDVSTSPTLEWVPLSGATYDVEVASDMKFDSKVGGGTDLTTASLQVSGLEAGKKYYWHVRAKTAVGLGAWSNSWSFTTGSPLLAEPNLLLPGDNAQGVSTSPTLVWSSVIGAVTYDLQVSLERQFRTVTLDIRGHADTTYTLSGLLPATTYYWQVRAVGVQGSGDWPRNPPSFKTGNAKLAAPRLVSPLDGVSNAPVDPVLDWAPVPGATMYSVQYATDRNLKQSPVEVNGIRTATYQLRGLTPKETYYWRVRAVDSTGSSEWSDIWGFTTGLSRLAAPALISPSDGAQGVSTNAPLEWFAVSGAISYSVQYTTHQQFKQDTLTLDGISKSSVMLAGLQKNKKYYWRVRTIDSTSTSDWSEARSFTTGAGALAAPLLVSPSNGAKGVSTSPSLEWAPSAGALSYTVQYSTIKNFNRDTVTVGGITKSSLTLIGLAKNETYYWRVSSSDSAGRSDWSQEHSFTTGSGNLAVPVLVSPSDGATGVSINSTFEWSASPGARMYSLQYATNPSFKQDTITISGISGTSHRVEELEKNKKYYWRVQAHDSTGASDWTPERSFTTGSGLLSAPLLISPTDGAVGVSIAPTLAWSASPGAQTYSVQYSTFKQFNKDVVEIHNITNSSHTLPDLSVKEIYYWRVSARDSAGASDWSAAWQFTTGSGRLGAPRLLSPGDGDEVPITPTLQWEPIAEANLYDVQVATDASFRNDLIQVTDLPTSSLTVTGLEPRRKHFWRVRARNARETSDWSTEWTFTVSSTATSVEPVEAGQPGEFVVHQNYPNPFNPSTTIRFSVPKESPVRIVVYTILGAAVQTLVDERLYAGTYETTWNASAMPSGVYFYRLEAGGFVAAKRLVLLK